METVVLSTSLLLLLWFWGCIVTYRIGKHLLVEGTGLKGAEFPFLVVYAAGIFSYTVWRPVGKWILLGILAFWIAIQFFSHWYYTIFGATQKKLAGYNRCSRGTVRIFPESDARLIPDLYHIVFHVLIVLDAIFLLIDICG